MTFELCTRTYFAEDFLHNFLNEGILGTFDTVSQSRVSVLFSGAPVIQKLSKQRGEDGQHKVLVCEAEGSPKPAVSWSINGTLVCMLTPLHHYSFT